MQRLRQLTFASLEHDRKKRRTRHDPDLRRRLERNTQRLAPLPGFSNLMIAQPHLIMTGEKRVWNLPDRPCGGSTGGDSAPKTRIWGSGPQKIGRRSREGRFPQPKPEPPPPPNQRFSNISRGHGASPRLASSDRAKPAMAPISMDTAAMLMVSISAGE